MMCGCPIGIPPWNHDEFVVMAMIKQGEYYSVELPLAFDENAPYGIPSQFANNWLVPKNETGQPAIYEMIVSAFQQKTGNTGVDKATAIIPPTTSNS
jgi:hypothetical protein